MSSNRNPRARGYTEEEAARWLADALRRRGLEYTPGPRAGQRRRFAKLCPIRGCTLPAMEGGAPCWRHNLEMERERRRRRARGLRARPRRTGGGEVAP